jgi:hypothetical protein
MPTKQQMKIGRDAERRYRAVAGAVQSMKRQAEESQRLISKHQGLVEQLTAEIAAIGQDRSKETQLRLLIAKLEHAKILAMREKAVFANRIQLLEILSSLEATVINAMQSHDFKSVVRGVSERQLQKGMSASTPKEYQKLFAMIKKFITRFDESLQVFAFEASELDGALDASAAMTAEMVSLSTRSEADVMAKAASIAAQYTPSATSIPTVATAPTSATAGTAAGTVKKA